jgi:hypothetical protein
MYAQFLKVTGLALFNSGDQGSRQTLLAKVASNILQAQNEITPECCERGTLI